MGGRRGEGTRGIRMNHGNVGGEKRFTLLQAKITFRDGPLRTHRRRRIPPGGAGGLALRGIREEKTANVVLERRIHGQFHAERLYAKDFSVISRCVGVISVK